MSQHRLQEQKLWCSGKKLDALNQMPGLDPRRARVYLVLSENKAGNTWKN